MRPLCESDESRDKSFDMEPERIARLTDQQRACLRFVYAHMTSKEIAPLLGIEPGSVDQHIKAAMRTLGVGDRRAAAKLLAEYEDRSGTPAVDFASSRPAGVAMREEQAGYDRTPPPDLPKVPLPIWGGRPSDFSPLRRLAWIFAIMLVIALTFGVFLAGLDALSRLGNAG
jgi:DNA-binding CsgD family transcriptional regulator